MARPQLLISKDAIEFLHTGNVILEADGTRWVHYPYWLKSTEVEDVYEPYPVQELPKRIEEILYRPAEEEKDMLNYPHKQLDMFKSEEEQ